LTFNLVIIIIIIILVIIIIYCSCNNNTPTLQYITTSDYSLGMLPGEEGATGDTEAEN